MRFDSNTVKHAVRETLVLWAGLLLCGGLALLLLALSPSRQWLGARTGELDLLPQIKGLTDLAGGVLRPQLHLAPQEVTDYADVSPFGINVFLEQEVEPAKREWAVQLAAQAGFKWLRQEFVWEDIEVHGKGDFEDRRHDPARSAWDKYDHIVALAEQYDLQLIVRISNPPAWSRANGNEAGPYAPPDNYQDFADFAGAVAARYQGRIRYYQLWNEPNIFPEWGVNTIDPEAYVELLKSGAAAIRAVDPEAVIIAGALAATVDLDGTTVPGLSFSDLLFLQRMYDAGAAPYFDVMATQGYGLWSGPTDRRMHPRVMNFGRPQFIRDLMVANGDGHKPIWISEMNWNAAPTDVEPRYGRVSLDEQSTNLPLAFERIREDWPWLGVANVWYLKRATDLWEQNRQPEAYFRLLAPDFTPQPVYESVRAYISSAGGQN
ncbi:MAG: glycoside hydrolase family 5 protein [Caldilineaceae bacterium SB0670_bin_27]|uniref:Glycoside hydrolase family 5 protein n=1 Tax=Caldilineaceae bacterium SB0664_bin_27 TaxID=2605260 RepID=A0A6B0YZJ0_9CHLR|nr:glycoside hydrolase family 5 protein [Caldilineaceae bacterium SB0664_bin_27]MYJ79593.1 glycoside hydrolase family 5 protein [Caldilineaceae bacterium SB0670_bin_27]